MKDNTDRLFEAIEHPEIFSDDDIRRILEDKETEEIYNIMSRTSDALTETDEPDIEYEWTCFVRKQNKRAQIINGFRHSLSMFFNRNMAAVLTGSVASLAVVAATLGITYSWQPAHDEPQAQMPAVTDSVVTTANIAEKADYAEVEERSANEPETVIFKEESFEAMIRTIANHYGASVIYRNDKSKELRMYFQWNPDQPLGEIVEQLDSFEQIEISLTDNTITIE